MRGIWQFLIIVIKCGKWPNYRGHHTEIWHFLIILINCGRWPNYRGGHTAIWQFLTSVINCGRWPNYRGGQIHALLCTRLRVRWCNTALWLDYTRLFGLSTSWHFDILKKGWNCHDLSHGTVPEIAGVTKVSQWNLSEAEFRGKLLLNENQWQYGYDARL